MSTILVIDATTRELLVFTASVTEAWEPTEDEGGIPPLVLRKGVEVGHLSDLEETIYQFPILVMGSYSAQSSEGFTLRLGHGLTRAAVVGGIGFAPAGAKEYPGLRLFREPLLAEWFPVGTSIKLVPGASNSNRNTAEAVIQGLRLRAELKKNFILAEGQSDVVRGWEVQPPEDFSFEDLPTEHRGEFFTRERVARSFMGFALRRGGISAKEVVERLDIENDIQAFYYSTALREVFEVLDVRLVEETLRQIAAKETEK